ncbi:hypothetical protein [Rhizobium sp. Root1220]|uniref:hypothetical protein n=1 Tax=Rhizobium sp. Root1220 TaxID=1736432 RepID=UPI0006F42F14|nr:hypothetical protein [Rhizobium sp. Root1220]KQV68048.1 hypothetical protein ASC90_10315 [Rhizobium sp. Root1220]
MTDADDDCPPDIAAAWAALDELFDDVSCGRMTPEEAEAEATRQGLRPLKIDPDPALFKPMATPTWTLAMTVAWIVWRTEEAVRDNWDDYRCKCSDWMYERRQSPTEGGSAWKVTEGWRLKKRKRATLVRLSFDEAYDDTMGGGESRRCVSVDAARKELWMRLTEGQLTATALNTVSTKPIQIPAHEWPYLMAKADDGFADELRYRQTPPKVEYREVNFSRADAIRLWPPSAKGRQTIGGERACQRWLESEMRALPHRRPKTKTQFRVEGTEKFTISDFAFDRVWRDAVTETGATAWIKAGAPKKSSN